MKVFVIFISILVCTVCGLDVKCDQRFPFYCFINTAIDLLPGEELNISPVEHEQLVKRFEIAPVSDLKSFPWRIFQIFPQLEAVTLNSANIYNVTSASFANASNLCDLHLKLNKLKTITRLLFAEAPQLEHMDLSGNEIVEIEEDGFGGLKKLRTLKLNDNCLKSLGARTFSGAPNLEYLHSYSNHLESIETGALALSKLTEAFFGNNRLRTLSDDLCDGTTNLEVTEFSNNQLRTIGNAFEKCQKIYFLNLENNPIEDLDLMKFTNMRSLSSLSLNNTNFRFSNELPAVNASHNSSLESLNLGNNNLSNRHIFAHLIIFPELQRLYLYNNRFTEFDDVNAIKKILPKLNTLDLIGNKQISQWLRDNNDSLKRDQINVLSSK